MNVYPKNRTPVVEVRKFIITFYIIGALGFLIPYSREFFITITPLALLLSTYLLVVYHKRYTRKDVFIFATIAVSGFFLEAIGVNTGIIFGHYRYGHALGLKLFHTPLLIGINWLFLTYTATSVSEKMTNKTALQIVIAPALMVMYDLILEQLAPGMQMWSWISPVVPVGNYLTWWVVGFLFVSLIKISGIDTRNPLAPILFVSQFLFLAVIFVVLSLFQ